MACEPPTSLPVPACVMIELERVTCPLSRHCTSATARTCFVRPSPGWSSWKVYPVCCALWRAEPTSCQGEPATPSTGSQAPWASLYHWSVKRAKMIAWLRLPERRRGPPPDSRPDRRRYRRPGLGELLLVRGGMADHGKRERGAERDRDDDSGHQASNRRWHAEPEASPARQLSRMRDTGCA